MKKSKKHQHQCRSKNEYLHLLSIFNNGSNIRFEMNSIVRSSLVEHYPLSMPIRNK